MRMLLMMLLAAVVYGLSLTACNDRIEVQQAYDFRVETLPVAKKIVKGTTVEIRCQLVRTGNYAGAKYTYRYFQPDGKGMLRMETGPALVPNDLYELTAETFRLYYTSQSEDQQSIDVYFFDNFERQFLLELRFNNESTKNQ